MFVSRQDVFGFIKPVIDAHVLGIQAVTQLLSDCGISSIIANEEICSTVINLESQHQTDLLMKWIKQNRISHIGLSYRLDPKDGVRIFRRLFSYFHSSRMLCENSGPINKIFFAGLPAACKIVKEIFGGRVTVFEGSESPLETLEKLGIPPHFQPPDLVSQVTFDSFRFTFSQEVLNKELHLREKPIDRSSYPGFGTRNDSIVARALHGETHALPPLMRAHLGPYSPNRIEAVHEFIQWCIKLSRDGLLDILSIGSSQLSQEAFGEPWEGKINGGGVPVNSPEEYEAIWKASLPMLVRTYAGTSKLVELAKMYEEHLNIAWHALSLWWFCKLDGRGPLSLEENLSSSFQALKVIATTQKPYEPNIAHHFSFRGADDVTGIVATILAARAAKKCGVGYLILQIMLNTPRHTWSNQDLAKARATLYLVRELEDQSFRVFLQPRAGLDFFTPDIEKAKVQLGAVTTLMDDIEPDNPSSPDIIHVVGYSEGAFLATPEVVNESIKITRAVLQEYRKRKISDHISFTAQEADIQARTKELIIGAKTILKCIEKCIDNYLSPEGFFKIFQNGFLPVPFLLHQRNIFHEACNWRTKFLKGGVSLVDLDNQEISVENRLRITLDKLKVSDFICMRDNRS